ncbi:MAG: methyltransferase [Verrucomicrobiia bacterium]
MKRMENLRWTAESLLELGRSYQAAAVFAAAADLELFDAVASRPKTAPELARALRAEARGLAILLDALVAIGLLRKQEGRYGLAPGVETWLTSESPKSILPMAQHQANCMRNWVQLARVVRSGSPAERMPSVRGEDGDQEAFIGAMHSISAPAADGVIAALRPFRFAHLLDVGAASGTWTMAFLRKRPAARATLFDLPEVIPMARRRLKARGYLNRVSLAAGDYNKDALPRGADLAWVSAIVHQNSRAQNRALFGRVFRALEPGGSIALRDILMEADRTRPVAGALFAVNMLVATEGGGTFTFEELRADLESAGFEQVKLARADEGMNAIVVATKPE